MGMNPNHRNWLMVRVPKGKRIMGQKPFNKSKVRLPTETDLPMQTMGGAATITIDGIGAVYVDPSKLDPSWITQCNRNSLAWKESKENGWKYANQAYTQENASKPVGAKEMWYRKGK